MLKLVVVSYIVIVVLVAVFQRRLLYFPTRMSRAQAEDAARHEGLIPWLSATGQQIGWCLPPSSTTAASVLVVHGNAGAALDRGYIARAVRAAAAVDVFILEYPGYGARGGSPTMSSLIDAADEAFAALNKDRPIFIVSESLGTGVAAYLARIHPDQVRGLVMFVPYDDLASVAQSAYWLLPARLILRDRFRPAMWLQNYRGPVKIVVAAADKEVPPRFGQRLYKSYRGRKTLQVVEDAAHNEASDQSVEWWRITFRFLNGESD